MDSKTKKLALIGAAVVVVGISVPLDAPLKVTLKRLLML